MGAASRPIETPPQPAEVAPSLSQLLAGPAETPTLSQLLGGSSKPQQEAVPLSQLLGGEKPKGFFAGLASGARRGAEDVGKEAGALKAIYYGTPPEPGSTTPLYSDTMADKPLSEKFNPLTPEGRTYLGEKAGQMAVGMAAPLAGAVAGGILTASPAGAMAGFTASSTIEATLGTYQAQVAAGKSPAEAWNTALKVGAVAGTGAAVSGAAVEAAPFASRLANTAFESGTQGAILAGQQAGTNVVTGRPVGEGVPEAALTGAAAGPVIEGSKAALRLLGIASEAPAERPAEPPAGGEATAPAVQPEAAAPTAESAPPAAQDGAGATISPETAQGATPAAETPEAGATAAVSQATTDSSQVVPPPAEEGTLPPADAGSAAASPAESLPAGEATPSEEVTAHQAMDPASTVTDAELAAAAGPDEQYAAEHPNAAFEAALADASPEDYTALEGDIADVSNPHILSASPAEAGLGNSPIKQLIHRLTGRFRVRDVMEVDPAVELRRSLRERQQASKLGEKYGRADERAKAREKIAAVRDEGKQAVKEVRDQYRAKDRDRRLAQQARREYERLVEQVTKPPGDDMAPDYQRRLQAVQRDYDFHSVTKGDIARHDAIAKAVEQGKPIPADLAEQARRRPIGDLTLAEMRDLAQQTADIRRLGRLKLKLGNAKVARELAAKSATMASDLAGKKRVGFDHPEASAPKGGNVEGYFARLMRPARMGEMLGQAFHKYLWRPLSEAHYRAAERCLNTQKGLLEGLRGVAAEHGFEDESDVMARVLDAHKSIGTGPFLNGAERIGVAMAAKNDLHKLTSGYLTRADGTRIKALTEQQVRDVVDSLTPPEKSVMNYMAARYAEQGPMVQAIFEKLTGKRLDLQQGYFPNIGESESLDNQSFQDPEALLRVFKTQDEATPTKTISDRFTKHKLPNGNQSIRIDALDVFNRNTRAVDFYVEVAPELAHAKRILNDPAVQAQIDRLSVRSGKAMNYTLGDYLKAWQETSGRPSLISVGGHVDSVMGWLRHNAVPAYLAYRLSTLVKHGSFSWLSAAEAGYAAPILKAQAAVLAEQVKLGRIGEGSIARNPIVAEMQAMFPEIKHSQFDREVDLFRQNTMARSTKRGKFGKQVDAIGRKGLVGLQNLDKLTRAWVAKGVFETELERHAALGPKAARAAAIERTKQVLENTQGDSRTVALPPMFTSGSEVDKILTMFGGRINQSLNQHLAVLQRVYGGKQAAFSKDTAMWLLAGIVIPSIYMAAANRAVYARDDNSPANDRMKRLGAGMPEALAEQVVGGLPLVGPVIEGAIRSATDHREFDPGEELKMEFPGVENPVRAAHGLATYLQAKPWNHATKDKALADFLTGTAGTFGLPAEAMRIGTQGVSDISAGKAGPGAIFASRYQRRPVAK